jgi:hypothetical protein
MRAATKKMKSFTSCFAACGNVSYMDNASGVKTLFMGISSSNIY